MADLSPFLLRDIPEQAHSIKGNKAVPEIDEKKDKWRQGDLMVTSGVCTSLPFKNNGL